MKTIEITTAHNIVLEYELATTRERMLAFILDLVAVLLINMILQVLLNLAFGKLLDGAALAAMQYLPAAILVFYCTFFEIFNNGQTIGKMAMKTRTVRLDGRQPSWSEMLGRSFLHFVDSVFSLGVLGTMLIKTTEKGQRLGDLAAGTVVIRMRPSLPVGLNNVLNLNTTKDWTPLYPQVKKLREADMLAIKTIVGRYLKYPNEAHYGVVVDLSERLADHLEIRPLPPDRVGFLRSLLKDYVVLTR